MTPGGGVEATTGVYEVLRDRILHAYYSPGHLLREAPVAEDLGVSRTPVREALIRLAENGLLERTTRGLRVRVRTVGELGEVYEACILVEPAVARLAALRRRPQHLVALDDVLDSTRRALDEGADNPQVQMDGWHRAVWRAADNDTLLNLLESLSAQLFSIPAPVLGITEWGVSLESHREMTDAIRRQDADAAEQLMRAHLEGGRDAALRSLTSLPTPPRT